MKEYKRVEFLPGPLLMKDGRAEPGSVIQHSIGTSEDINVLLGDGWEIIRIVENHGDDCVTFMFILGHRHIKEEASK